eukprot:TRINITY_DN731_c0_g1_i1.p1 TRINITY_DN731_c0_g1~~TRINITY_DN731_c0_g1_i1.p1  ORF type:complete len:463 (-),score=150.78 TRINITY_DN731_c0_g1_i1:143-1531(-)
MENGERLKRKREHRELLGVDENADEETIKKAYRALAREYHPDRQHNKGKKEESERMFAKITEAYESIINSNNTLHILKSSFKCSKIGNSLEQFLSSTNKMGNFNSVPASDFSLSNGSPAPANFGSNSSFSLSNMNSLGSSFLNQISAKYANNNQGVSSPHLGGLSTSSFSNLTKSIPRRGQSLQTTLKLTFEEALYGCIKTIEFSKSLNCQQCKGSGTHLSSNMNSVSGSPPQTTSCRDCGGKGVASPKLTGLVIPISNFQTTCITCSGSGVTIVSPTLSKGFGCSACNGAGKTSSRRNCTVNVPAGVMTGNQTVFEGEGDEGTEGAQSGDLIICFDVTPHPYYQRHQNDVYWKISIPFPHMALGIKMEVPSIYGDNVSVNIPPGTQNKQVIQVTGQGFHIQNPTDGKLRGDMYLQISVETPSALTDIEKKLLFKLASQDNFKFKLKNSSESPSAPSDKAPF